WARLYDPSRVRVKSAKNFIKENVNAVWNFKEWLTGGTAQTEEQIRPRTGAVLRHGLNKIAAYRDEEGNLHELSAVCPHMGCIVAWNPSEKSWDCPCHGSRFTPEGKVVTGPSIKDLAPASKKSLYKFSLGDDPPDLFFLVFAQIGDGRAVEVLGLPGIGRGGFFVGLGKV